MTIETMVVPVISTAHWPNEHAVEDLHITKASYEYGAFVFVGGPMDDQPEWIKQIGLWALVRKQYWVRFDSIGDVIPGLQTWEW